LKGFLAEAQMVVRTTDT